MREKKYFVGGEGFSSKEKAAEAMNDKSKAELKRQNSQQISSVGKPVVGKPSDTTIFHVDHEDPEFKQLVENFVRGNQEVCKLHPIRKDPKEGTDCWPPRSCRAMAEVPPGASKKDAADL